VLPNGLVAGRYELAVVIDRGWMEATCVRRGEAKRSLISPGRSVTEGRTDWRCGSLQMSGAMATLDPAWVSRSDQPTRFSKSKLVTCFDFLARNSRGPQ